MHLVFSCLNQNLQNVLQKVKENFPAHDHVRIEIDSKKLTVPIWTSLVRCDQIDLSRWLFDDEQVINSNQQFCLNETLSPWIQHKIIPAGSRKRDFPKFLQIKLTKKRCVTQI